MNGLRVTKNVIAEKKGLGRVGNKKKFPDTKSHKTFETNSSFHMK